MTGPEIAHAPARGLSPIVVLVNNAGWGIFRPVSPRADLLEIPPWPYAELAQAWGGVGIRACEVGAASSVSSVTRMAAARRADFPTAQIRIPPRAIAVKCRNRVTVAGRPGAFRRNRCSAAAAGVRLPLLNMIRTV